MVWGLDPAETECLSGLRRADGPAAERTRCAKKSRIKIMIKITQQTKIMIKIPNKMIKNTQLPKIQIPNKLQSQYRNKSTIATNNES
jgi:hypothetical protein